MLFMMLQYWSERFAADWSVIEPKLYGVDARGEWQAALVSTVWNTLIVLLITTCSA